jgi:TM2 domain-containing membrane protein YozV
MDDDRTRPPPRWDRRPGELRSRPLPEARRPRDPDLDDTWSKRPSLDPYATDLPQPHIAALLSLAFSGLGQLYNGRPVRGLLAMVLPAVLLIIAAHWGGMALYLIAFGSGACTAPLALDLFAALVGWLPLGHPAFWMGLPFKAALVAEAAVDAYRSQRRHREPEWPAWATPAFAAGTGLLLVVWIFSTGLTAVRQPSMTPLAEPGDQVVVDRLAFGLQIPLFGWRIGGRDPRRGEPVAVLDPARSGKVLVRRVFAVPGDRVGWALAPAGFAEPLLGVAGGEPRGIPREAWTGPCVYPSVTARGLRRERYHRCRAFIETQGRRRYVASFDREREPTLPVGLWNGRVPKGKLFLLSDNRASGPDSRTWGPVSTRRLRGRPRLVLWSTDPFEGIRWHRMGHRIDDRL